MPKSQKIGHCICFSPAQPFPPPTPLLTSDAKPLKQLAVPIFYGFVVVVVFTHFLPQIVSLDAVNGQNERSSKQIIDFKFHT